MQSQTRKRRRIFLCEAAPELDKELVLASQEWLADQYKAEVEQWGYIDPARWDAFINGSEIMS